MTLMNVSHEMRTSYPVVRQRSPIEFDVLERPITFAGKTGSMYNVDDFKALVRLHPETNAPVALNVVRSTYKTVQNKELFDAVNTGVSLALRGVGPDYTEGDVIALRDMQVRDRISYLGVESFREYVFPNVSCRSPQGDSIAFRIIVQNSFGSGAIKLYAGAIDFYCTNGLILGNYISLYKKHTSGLKLASFTNHVQAALEVFHKNVGLYEHMANTSLLGREDEVLNWLTHKFGERLANKLMDMYLHETGYRGANFWALFSALTRYASHTDVIPVRNTKNDHEASTLLGRELTVQKHTMSNLNGFYNLDIAGA